MKWKSMRSKPLGSFLDETAKSVTENLKGGNVNEEKVLATDLRLQLLFPPGIIARQVGGEIQEIWSVCDSLHGNSIQAFLSVAKQAKPSEQTTRKTKKVFCLSLFQCFHHWPSLFDLLIEPIRQHSFLCTSYFSAYRPCLRTTLLLKSTVFPWCTVPHNYEPHPRAGQSSKATQMPFNAQILVFESCMGSTYLDWFIPRGWKLLLVTCYDIGVAQAYRDPSSSLQGWYQNQSETTGLHKKGVWAGAWTQTDFL